MCNKNDKPVKTYGPQLKFLQHFIAFWYSGFYSSANYWQIFTWNVWLLADYLLSAIHFFDSCRKVIISGCCELLWVLPAVHNGSKFYVLWLNNMLCKHPNGDAEKSDDLWTRPSPAQWIEIKDIKKHRSRCNSSSSPRGWGLSVLSFG